MSAHTPDMPETCPHCGGNGFSGGLVVKDMENDDACEVCLGSGLTKVGEQIATRIDAVLAKLHPEWDADQRIYIAMECARGNLTYLLCNNEPPISDLSDATDPRTGRAWGDHGTAEQAIGFALDWKVCEDAATFLRSWREGNLDEWFEFYDWLSDQESALATGETPR